MKPLRVASLGLVTSRGLGVEPFAEALRSDGFPRELGHSSSRWAARKYGVALVDDLAGLATRTLPGIDTRRTDRVGILGLLAASDALGRAGLATPLGDRAGLVFGCTHGSIAFTTEYHEGAVSRGAKGLSAFLFSSSLLSSAAAMLALALGIRGPVHTLAAGATAAADVVELSSLLLETGQADTVLAVGAEAFHSVYLDAYDALFRLHARLGRPPDPVRAFSYAEGAAALVLDTNEGPGPGRIAGTSGTLAGAPWQSPLLGTLAEAWDRAGLAPTEADLFLTASNHSFLDRLEAEALAHAAGGPPVSRGLALKTKTGEGFAYTSMLQVAAGLLLLEPGQRALAQAVHFDGTVGAIALERRAP